VGDDPDWQCCNTSMAEFIMCPSCQQEYGAPDNRRFHAQANCCPDCGPQAWLEDNATHRINTANVIQQAALLIQQGHIIAIKGIGNNLPIMQQKIIGNAV
jgi:hydrogenase maturation protein HypF